MSILDNPIDEPNTHAANLIVAFPNQNNWLSQPSSQGKDYETEKNDHVQTVRRQIDVMIWLKSVGKAIMEDIKKRPSFKVRVFPYKYDPNLEADQRAGIRTGAVTIAVDPVSARSAGGIINQITPPPGPGQPTTITETTYIQGQGSAANIFYSVSVLQNRRAMPDEFLLHELVHASQHQRGATAVITMNGGGYPDNEEFLANMVENMYRSQKRNRELFDYEGNQLDPRTFLDRNLRPPPRQLLGLFRALHPSLFRALSELNDAPFNPVKQVLSR